MTNKDFGNQLRFFRQQTIDPLIKKPLTQQRLGEFLGRELGIRSFTGAAVSDWERTESRINASDRLVLLGLVGILKEYGGIKNTLEANTLLEAGNYRALDRHEKEKIFPGEYEEPIVGAQSTELSGLQFLFGTINLISPAEYRKLYKEAQTGPAPSWHRLAVSLTNQILNKLTTHQVLRGVLWVWIWLSTYYLISPSLNWHLLSTVNIFFYLGLYVAGALIIPLFIGAMTNTKDNAFWMEQKMQNSFMLRLYVYQGAYVGFHVGYFLLIPFSLIQVQVGLGESSFLEAVKIIVPLWISNAGSHLIPYNLWLAYKRLDVKDGGIFFVFVFFAPLWGWFFLEFYHIAASPMTGAILFLASLTMVIAFQTIKSEKKAS